jgi:hypothetical protein
MSIGWRRDPDTEAYLAKLGISFQFRERVPISRLDLQASQSNNARFGAAVKQDTVTEYAYHMLDGAEFPAIVITESYFVLAGIQRTSAAIEAGRKEVDVYVIDAATPKIKQDMFIRGHNNLHGLKNTVEERIRHAVSLHLENPRLNPLKTLCDQYFGDNDKLYQAAVNECQAEQVRRLLGRLGVDPTKYVQSVLVHLYQLRNNERVMKSTARAIADSRLASDQAYELIRGVQSEPDEKAKIAYARKFAEDNTPRKRANTVRTNFVRAINAFCNVTTEKGITSFIDLGFDFAQDGPEIERYCKQLSSLEKAIKDLRQSARQAKRRTVLTQ